MFHTHVHTHTHTHTHTNTLTHGPKHTHSHAHSLNWDSANFYLGNDLGDELRVGQAKRKEEEKSRQVIIRPVISS